MEERQLVQDIISGDEKALRIFWKTLSPLVLAYIQKRIGSREDADEILQDTFLASLESLRDFDFRCQLSTFIRSIAQHKIVDYYRKRRLKQVFFSQLSEDFLPLISQLLGPEEEFDVTEIRFRIQKVFAKIKPLHKTILVLKYLEGRSVIEIAQALSISFKSAESSLFRARLEFAKLYQVV